MRQFSTRSDWPHWFRLRRASGAVLVAAALLAACATQTTLPGAVGVDRQQMLLIPAADMDRAAEQSYRQILREAQAKGQLNHDAGDTARVRAIANRLIPATAAFRADAPAWRWEVNVIDSKELNAWCMPGGKIAVYSGLIDTLRPTDAELAAVMGHEIAHALREHGRERASQAQAANLGLTFLGAAAGLSRNQVDLAGQITDLTVLHPNSRQNEAEADRIGVELAARAGYDPQAAVSLWEKMAARNGGQPPQWLSTHPSHATRIADLQVAAERVQPLYVAARRTLRPERSEKPRPG
ncbi:M48 family metallopeptidase [Rhodocyclus gracilis]|uniref:M48 family metalloprotease n=1 Tax=Rhodocyclus tenuis TaxID=1066 RepID=A0A6L5JUI2_RHOTE|nr:M48 family metallopeptidase [Rhodocyclus gracilis]MQY50482.1 M48 family metalloprotease [Rhodocyclus gracilis]